MFQFPPLRRRVGSKFAIIAASLVLTAIVWCVELLLLEIERSNTIENAVIQNSNLVKDFEQHALRAIESVDNAAIALEREYLRLGGEINLAAHFSSRPADSRLVTAISIINERGEVVAASDAGRTWNLATRDYFQAHLGHDSGKLFIGRPIADGADGTWSIHMSRRINRADGSFGGVVAMAVDPRYFTNFYRQSRFGKDGELALIGVDGITRARRSGNVMSFGQDAVEHSLYKAYAKSASSSFLYGGRSGEPSRYVSMRTLSEYPQMIMVGTSQNEVLAPYAEHARDVYLGAAVVSMLIAVLAVLHSRRTRRTIGTAAFEPGILEAVAASTSAPEPVMVDTAQPRPIARAARTVTLRGVQVERRLTRLQTAEGVVESARARESRPYLAYNNRPNGPVTRDVFDSRLDFALGLAQRRNTVVCVMSIVIGRAGTADAHGVQDQMKLHAAARLATCVRDEDTIARFSADEYAVVLPQIAHGQDGGLVARKIINALGARYDIEGQESLAIVSIGVATYPYQADNAADLLKFARAACSEAKQQRVSNFAFYASPGSKSEVAA